MQGEVERDERIMIGEALRLGRPATSAEAWLHRLASVRRLILAVLRMMLF